MCFDNVSAEVLRCKGMSSNELQDRFRALVIFQLAYTVASLSYYEVI